VGQEWAAALAARWPSQPAHLLFLKAQLSMDSTVAPGWMNRAAPSLAVLESNSSWLSL
jgi:hypothetical protein